MRIDLVITELFPGGAERCLTRLAIGLAELGDQVRVFSIGSLPRSPRDVLVRQLHDADIDVVSAEADTVWRLLPAARRLQAFLESSPPAICQSFLFHANVLAAGAVASVEGTTLIGGVRVAEGRPLRCAVERHAVSRMSRVVCVSDGVARFARQRLKCHPAQTVVIPNGVDVDRFARAEPYRWSRVGWPEDSVVSLFAGRFHRQKGIELIQQQIDALAPSGSRRRLLLVGEGSLGPALQRWAESIGRERVQLLPWQADIGPLLGGCRVLILPSHYEGMPNVALEAMATGRPVVCSHVEGSSELFRHQFEAQVFPTGDSQAMVQRADRFLSDPEFSARVGAENQSRVTRDFSITAMIQAYRTLYRSLDSSGGRS